jgi:hypothetical protein
MAITWDDIKRLSVKLAEPKGEEYISKLQFEIKEIEKQGANDYWIDLIKNGKKFENNKNGLVLPYLLKITPVDPIVGEKYLCVEDKNGILINGVEITLEDGTVIKTSNNTLIKTNRGYVKAFELTEDDEVI